MIRVLTIIALIVAILAGSTLIVRHFPWQVHFDPIESARKDVERLTPSQLAAPAPVPVFPQPSQLAAPVNVVPSQQAAPAIVAEQPTQQPIVRKAASHKKSKAATKLKSRWVAPADKPFDIKDLFNVH